MNAPRILVVEGRDLPRCRLRRVLSGFDVETREVARPASALALLRRGRPFALVLAGLGDVPGEALRFLARARDAGVTAPFVFLARLPEDALCETASDLGDAVVLELPSSDDRLTDVVAQVLSEGAVPAPESHRAGGRMGRWS